MAVALNAVLGSANGPGATTLAITTIATAAAGSRIVVILNYWDGGATNARVTGVNDGSAYTKDKQVINGDDITEIWSRVLVGQLTSGATITGTWSPAFSGGVFMSAVSFTGTTGLDTTSSSTSTGASWSSGSATNAVADSVYVGGAGFEDATNPTTSTATSGTEIHDLYRSAEQQGFTSAYKIVSTIASTSVAGTLSNANSTSNTGALAIYSGTAGGTVVKNLAALGVG